MRRGPDATRRVTGAACDVTGAACRVSVGPLVRRIDLTPHRGQRVFLTADVRASFFIGVNFYAALVDDIQIR